MHEDIEKLSLFIEKNEKLKSLVRIKNQTSVHFKGQEFPLTSFTMGSTDPQAPTLILTGGIHGIERIGAQLCLSLLKTTLEKLVWDESFHHLLKNIRLVFYPLANPVGYHHFTRSNGQGVDLMRNSPVDATDRVPYLLGGHRLSKYLPWYRGKLGVIEAENQALFDVFNQQAAESLCVISVDFHSGFGLKDRLWFPYSKTRRPFEHLAELHSLTELFEKSYPFHVYKIEPQSDGYLLHGDVWDHLYLEFIKKNRGTYIPLTLEMGSWMWVKKNPWQLISRSGLFNPMKDHRTKRIFRRHHLFFDFLIRALHSYPAWAQMNAFKRQQQETIGIGRWYEK